MSGRRGQEGRAGVEAQARAVGRLIDHAEDRAPLIVALTAAIAAAVEELDPLHERDTAPTWLRELGPFGGLDAFDRIRASHDQIIVIEAQAEMVVADLRGWFRGQPAGTPARPLGLSAWRALDELSSRSAARTYWLKQISDAEHCRSVHYRLTDFTSAEVRRSVRDLQHVEKVASADRSALSAMRHAYAS